MQTAITDCYVYHNPFDREDLLHVVLELDITDQEGRVVHFQVDQVMESVDATTFKTNYDRASQK